MAEAEDLLRHGATGQHSFGGTKTITYPFRNYVLKILTSLDGKFIGVTEISIAKEFLNHQQKIGSARSHDLEEFYKDEDG
jgi:hypothetical protein